MRQTVFWKFAIATATAAVATLFSLGWSEQRGISLSVESAQARARLYVTPNYYNPYRADQSGLPWYAVRAYYAGGPWCGAGGYGTAGGAWGGPYRYSCYGGWADYKQVNGIGCDPGTIVKGGDGINYMCQ
jgi:hypothetical protein